MKNESGRSPSTQAGSGAMKNEGGMRNEAGNWVDPLGNEYPRAQPMFRQEVSRGSVRGLGSGLQGGGNTNGLADAFQALMANTHRPQGRPPRGMFDYSPVNFGGGDHEAESAVRRQFAGAIMDRDNDERGFRDRAFEEDRRRFNLLNTAGQGQFDQRLALMRELFGRSPGTQGWGGQGTENPFLPRAVGAAYQPFGQQPERQDTLNYLRELMGQDAAMRTRFGGGRG